MLKYNSSVFFCFSNLHKSKDKFKREGGKNSSSWISIGSVLFSRSGPSSWRQELNLRCPKLFDQWVHRHLNWLNRIGGRGYSSPPPPHNSSFLYLVFLWTILGLHCCKQIKDYFVALLFSKFDWNFIFLQEILVVQTSFWCVPSKTLVCIFLCFIWLYLFLILLLKVC